MERVGDILKALLAEGALKKGQKYISFYSSWDQIVGEPLSHHTKAVDVQRGSLIVQVDHPGWFQMFRFKEKEILRRVSKRFPDLKIKNIKVRVVPATEKTARVMDGREKGNHSAADDAEGTIDSDLQKALDRLYVELLERGKDDKR